MDASQRHQIVNRLQKDGINADVDSEGYITVDNDSIATRYRSILVSEGFEPTEKDPYSLFDTQRWSRTKFDDMVNWQRAQEAAVQQHLEQLDGIISDQYKKTIRFDVRTRGLKEKEPVFAVSEEDLSQFHMKIETEDE